MLLILDTHHIFLTTHRDDYSVFGPIEPDFKLYRIGNENHLTKISSLL